MHYQYPSDQYYYPMPAYMPAYPQEQQQPQPQPVPMMVNPITPTYNDVLMGRGGKNNRSAGNEQLRQLARAMTVEYNAADKTQKSAMAVDLVDQVQSLTPPGRFLKRDSVSMAWKIVPFELAREKCSQCLRDAVLTMKKQGHLTEPKKQRTTKAKVPSSRRSTTPESVELKRKVSHENKNEQPSKRRRTMEEPNECDDAASTVSTFSISPQVWLDLLASDEMTPSKDRRHSHQEVSVVSEETAQKKFNCSSNLEFELFDCDDLLQEEQLLCF